MVSTLLTLAFIYSRIKILIEGLLWADPSTGYHGRPQDRIAHLSLPPTPCHEGLPSLRSTTVYVPLKQGNQPYCLWGTDSPTLSGFSWSNVGCPEWALAGISGHRSERHMAQSGSEASQSWIEPPTRYNPHHSRNKHR